MKYLVAILLPLTICAFSVSYKNGPKVPTKEIAPGVHMPMQGLGTWLYNDTVAYDAATKALSIGYMHIDTAADYSNAKGVAKALIDSGRARNEYFLTTKIGGGLTYNETISQALTELANLEIAYCDLLLIHFPFSADGSPFSAEGRAEQWRALEFLHKQGYARAIGVSHFCKSHLQELLKTAKIRPALNQVEYHIGMGSAGPNATDDKEWCQSQNITYMPFSELCGPCCMGQPKNCTYNKELITGKMVTDIGKKYNKSGAQVSLRWCVQQGLPVIPKADKLAYLQEDIDIFDFELSAEDMAVLTTSPTPPVCGAGDGLTSGDCAFP